MVGLKMVATAFAGVLAALTALPAWADSCWNHNGSLMRLKDNGNYRAFYYEVPKSGLAQAGVTRGTLLFDGVKDGNTYRGTARVFSKYCPGSPLEYSVKGPVSSDQLKVTLKGRRAVHDQCEPTGGYTTDTLVFTYKRDC